MKEEEQWKEGSIVNRMMPRSLWLMYRENKRAQEGGL